MHKIRILWYRGIKVLDSAAKPRANATCDCRDFTHRCIAAKSDCRFFDIARCITKMVLFFVQGSTFTRKPRPLVNDVYRSYATGVKITESKRDLRMISKRYFWGAFKLSCMSLFICLTSLPARGISPRCFISYQKKTTTRLQVTHFQTAQCIVTKTQKGNSERKRERLRIDQRRGMCCE